MIRDPRRRAWILGGTALACLLLFVLVAVAGTAGGLRFDEPVLRFLGARQTIAATRVALALDLLGISYLLVPVTLLVAWSLAEARRARDGVFLVGCVIGAVAVNLAAKQYFGRARPEVLEALTPATNASFPSGHAMGSLAFALGLAAVLGRIVPRHRGSLAATLLIFALGVGLSRMYLQVHYPSDVLAAWALSGAWVALVALFHPPGPERDP